MIPETTIQDHFDNKKFSRITRNVAKNSVEVSRGYIVSYSKDFLILQETDDFKVLGYNILPINQIEKIRHNKYDSYYGKIVVWEDEIKNVGINYKIDLTNWQTIFQSIKNYRLNVIVECEDPAIDSFTIGPITKTTKNSIYIQNFDPSGFLDEKPTSIDYESISMVKFDDRYINVFSKYLRKRKVRSSK